MDLAVVPARGQSPVRSAEFIKFLNKINREVPAHLDVHVILDNLSTHKTPAVHKWLLRHRRFHFHFTPTRGSAAAENSASTRTIVRTGVSLSRDGPETARAAR